MGTRHTRGGALLRLTPHPPGPDDPGRLRGGAASMFHYLHG